MSTYNHILLVANDELLKKEISSYLLEQEYAVSLSQLNDALDLITSSEPDLIMSVLDKDLSLIKKIKEHSPSTPLIILVTIDEIDKAKQALELGAIDCILLPLEDTSIFDRVIKRGVEKLEKIDENKTYRHELEVLNAQLKKSYKALREDQKAARAVQAKLLPKKELVMDDITISYKIRTSLYLSGDFVDYYALDDNCIAMYLLDVSGHGAASAFVTILVKTLLQNLRDSQIIYNPAQVLTYLNSEVISLDLGKHLTMVYAVFNMQDNVLTYCGAGHHPSPIIFDKKHSGVTQLNCSGFPVGVVTEPHYKNSQLQLPEQFSISFFTDGILDLMPGDLQEKEKILCEISASGVNAVKEFYDKSLESSKEVSDDVSLMNFSKG